MRLDQEEPNLVRGAATEGSEPPVIEENAPAKPHPRALVTEMLWQNPGVVATLGYLYLTVIGIAFTVFFFLEFGVPIAAYSEPTDYVVAGLREPLLFVYSVASIVFLKRLMRRDRKMRERSNSYRRLAERMEASRLYNQWVVATAVVVAYFASATFM